jgi:ABC-type taurine transport system ATPase subunit
MSFPLELTGLTKVFPTPSGPFIAVKDVNAIVQTGEFVTILGHSGCGKSTVLSIVAGLDRATYGGIVIDGTQVDAPGAERAIVFQSPCLLPWLTARQNVVRSSLTLVVAIGVRRRCDRDVCRCEPTALAGAISLRLVGASPPSNVGAIKTSIGRWCDPTDVH